MSKVNTQERKANISDVQELNDANCGMVYYDDMYSQDKLDACVAFLAHFAKPVTI
jgi:hypothetical protein